MADIKGAQFETVEPEVRAGEPAPAAEMADIKDGAQVEALAPVGRDGEPAPAAEMANINDGAQVETGEPAPGAEMAVQDAQVEAVTPDGRPRGRRASAAVAERPAGGPKRKRGPEKTMSVEEVTDAIKKFNEEADRHQAAAEAARANARKLSQAHARQLREAALARLESACPKEPRPAFVLFKDEVGPTVTATGRGGFVKKMAELWAALSDEEKKTYSDKAEAAKKEYMAWSASEEGRKVLDERNEVLRQCKAAKCELDKATAAPTKSQLEEVAPVADVAPVAATTSPSGLAQAFAMGAAPEMTPAKRRRPAALPSADPVLDEKVLDAASRADLLAPLRNLAARPAVLALKKSSQELLDALTASGGLVNAAQRSLLGE